MTSSSPLSDALDDAKLGLVSMATGGLGSELVPDLLDWGGEARELELEGGLVFSGVNSTGQARAWLTRGRDWLSWSWLLS